MSQLPAPLSTTTSTPPLPPPFLDDIRNPNISQHMINEQLATLRNDISKIYAHSPIAPTLIEKHLAKIIYHHADRPIWQVPSRPTANGQSGWHLGM
ncbi:hypothetical protein BDV93DRAFT_555316 [Ceratobasidium sp. AG-I]|nr:hypothetical protein BDV93DRAFT_555316 [Ceratobasidium sp. AG-I]